MLRVLNSLTLILLLTLFSVKGMTQEPGQNPSLAFDTQNQRYLMVWEEAIGDSSTIKGKFLNPNGSELDDQVFMLTPERSRQGCFYENFSRDFSGVTQPSRCPRNANPTVAYNNGTFLLVWEVRGEAEFPEGAANGENEFSGVFARLLDANSLDPTGSLGAEGVLVSKVQIAANNAVQCSNGNYVCSDSEIQAWGQALKPGVAPRLGSNGFIVTWETNKDFIGCANPERRSAKSVYGRYIDAEFSPTGSNNPNYFAIFTDDSTLEDSCVPLENVDSAENARVAFNATSSDFMVVYERARANGGSSSLGAKQVTVSGREAQVSGGAMMAGTLASLEGENLQNPEIISFGDQFVLFTESSDGIRVKAFQSSSITNTTPALLELSGSNLRQPNGATNLGIGGQGPTLEEASPRILLSYQHDGGLSSVVLDENLSPVQEPANFSQEVAGNGQNPRAASDGADFVVSWQGENNGDKVFATFIDMTGDVPPPPGEPPTQPQPQSPEDDLVLSPVRAYLSWTESTDPEGGNVTYNLYIGEDVIPADPQVTGMTDLNYVIGPETESETGLSLSANTTYQWQVEAVDEGDLSTLSPIQTFSTDDSVVAWWRFDTDPNGANCPGGSGGETVCDYSGNNHHGRPMGNPNWIMPGMPDFLGGALEFDGVDDYVVVENNNQLNLDSMSVVTVIDSLENASEQQIIDKRQSGVGAGYDIRVYGDTFPLNIQWIIKDNNNENFVVGLNMLAQNSKCQIVGTFESTTGEALLFVDGNLITSENFGALDRSIKSSTDLIFGDWSIGLVPSGFNLHGAILEVLMFDRVLSGEEVSSSYQIIE